MSFGSRGLLAPPPEQRTGNYHSRTRLRYFRHAGLGIDSLAKASSEFVLWRCLRGATNTHLSQLQKLMSALSVPKAHFVSAPSQSMKAPSCVFAFQPFHLPTPSSISTSPGHPNFHYKADTTVFTILFHSSLEFQTTISKHVL